MKPKNKFQKQVLEASQNLPPVSKAQIQWAYRNCMQHIGRRTAKGVVICLECGHEWTDKTVEKHCACPHCNTKLQIADTRQRVFKGYEYFCIVTVCAGFQVLRFFYLQSYAKKGEKAQYFHSEVAQKWIAPDGRYATMAKLRPMSYYADTWNFSSTLEIRPERPLYNTVPTGVYPRQKLIPELKRSGYKGEFYNLTPFELFHALLTDSRAETLLKAGQTDLLNFFTQNGFRHIDRYWTSIRICIRNAYRVEDASIWRDYIDLLRFFGKDLYNAQYVCPAGLKAEHDRYVRKKREWQERERREQARKKALEDEAVFREMKSRFFGLRFTDGLIQVRVLESVEEIMQEGNILHHCVFLSGYHLKPDSLIFSASVDGKQMETVELSLSKWQVLQSRGTCNKNTEYHERIIELVKKNISLIRKRKRNAA
jgi:DNA-directed RNA polymerase subunit RPC12/RpoP